MPVQNELCGILLEDFLSIWKLRAVFLSGILVILFEGMMDLGVLELMGADSYLSGILKPTKKMLAVQPQFPLSATRK